ncbi:MAG: RNA recognition motif domain-containing protein [Bryobacteraceae bacterium]
MKLYVGNVPYQATDEDLRNMFTLAGVTLDSVNIVRDRFSGEPRGFAFVEIGNDEEAQKAIRACNGKDLLGRTLVINEARPPREGGDRGRGGSGGGGGGGRGRGGSGGGGGRGRW